METSKLRFCFFLYERLFQPSQSVGGGLSSTFNCCCKCCEEKMDGWVEEKWIALGSRIYGSELLIYVKVNI